MDPSADGRHLVVAVRKMKAGAVCVALCAITCAPVKGAVPLRSLSRSDIRSAMHNLAEGVVELDDASRRPSATISQDDVLGSLRKMQASVALLSGGETSSHPLLQSNLPSFRRELDEARVAAEASPPSYYLAGSIAGACLYCHASRR